MFYTFEYHMTKLMAGHLFTRTGLTRNETLVDLAEFIKLQGTPETLMIFCDHFLSCLVGKVEWKRKSQINLLKILQTIVMRYLHYSFLKISGMTGLTSIQRGSFSKKKNKQSNKQKQ